MSRKQNLLSLLCLATIAACATGEPVKRDREPRIGEIARIIGCDRDQVAVCVEVDCRLDDYYCAAREDVKGLLGADDYRF